MHDYGRDRCMRNCAWRWRTLSAGCRLRTGLEHWEWRRSSQGGDQCRHDAPLYCTGMAMVAPPPTWRRAKLSVFECHAHCMYVAAAKHRGHRTGGGGREVSVGRGAGARVRAAAACALATHATPTGPGPGAGVPGLRCCARTLCLPASAAAGLIFGSSACSRVLQECPSQSCSSTFISWVYVESLIQDVQRERPEKPECKMIRAYLDHIWIQIDRFHHSKRSAMKIK